jgi:hypothetical protein
VTGLVEAIVGNRMANERNEPTGPNSSSTMQTDETEPQKMQKKTRCLIFWGISSTAINRHGCSQQG